MGNVIFLSGYSLSNSTSTSIPVRPSQEAQILIKSLRRQVTINGLCSVLNDYHTNLAPKEIFDFAEFDDLISPLINSPRPLFDFLRDGHNVNFYEVFIALVFFTKSADYDQRIQLVFNVFDVDGSGSLDRKELTKLLTASI